MSLRLSIANTILYMIVIDNDGLITLLFPNVYPLARRAKRSSREKSAIKCWVDYYMLFVSTSNKGQSDLLNPGI